MTNPITGMIINGYIGQENIHPMRQGPGNNFRILDDNADDGIDKTEFSDLAGRISEATGNTLIVDDVYSMYDLDADGSLNSEELRSFLIDNPLPPPPQIQWMNALSAYGANNGGDSVLDVTA